jgi:hypothetical protein
MSPRLAQRNIRPPCSARTPATAAPSSRASFARVQPGHRPALAGRGAATGAGWSAADLASRSAFRIAPEQRAVLVHLHRGGIVFVVTPRLRGPVHDLKFSAVIRWDSVKFGAIVTSIEASLRAARSV